MCNQKGIRKKHLLKYMLLAMILIGMLFITGKSLYAAEEESDDGTPGTFIVHIVNSELKDMQAIQSGDSVILHLADLDKTIDVTVPLEEGKEFTIPSGSYNVKSIDYVRNGQDLDNIEVGCDLKFDSIGGTARRFPIGIGEKSAPAATLDQSVIASGKEPESSSEDASESFIPPEASADSFPAYSNQNNKSENNGTWNHVGNAEDNQTVSSGNSDSSISEGQTVSTSTVQSSSFLKRNIPFFIILAGLIVAAIVIWIRKRK